MIDTKINDRQQSILHQLIRKPHSRKELEVTLGGEFSLSKITILRDLKRLMVVGWVVSSGTGRATEYSINSSRSLLIPLDISDYFVNDSALRQFAKESFNPEVFELFGEVIFSEEQRLLLSKAKNIQKQKKLLDPTIFKRELERFIIEFSWKSSRIEGNTYSLLETEQLIKQRQEAAGHTKEEAAMILNHKEALEFILTNPTPFKTIDKNKIINIHALLVKGLSITLGIRSQQVGIAGTNYVPPVGKPRLEKYLESAISLINKTDYPLAKALIAACLIAYIQPFADGNKRTSRMIANALLLAYDLYPLSYRDVDELEYKKALIIFYEQNNLYNFKKMFLGQFIFANNKYFQ